MDRVFRIAAEAALPAAFPLAAVIYDAVTRSQKAVETAETEGPESLATEARSQKAVMDFQAHTARVAQEFAIAQRIASADEVEIEEYYEGSGKGTAGVRLEEKGLVAGLGGEGQCITRRVVKLKGSVVVIADGDSGPESES